MFCRYKVEFPDSSLQKNTVYWLNIKAADWEGSLWIELGSFFRHKYDNFEEFLSEWEIV